MPAVARTLRRNRLRMRRSRSATRPTCSTDTETPYADLAEVLVLGEKHDEAIAALEQALARYERKGNLVSGASARERLAALTLNR